MTIRNAPGLLGAALLATTLTAACAPGLGLGGVGLPGGRGTTVSGEIRSVDRRDARIHLREDRGRVSSFRYDRRTRVIVGQRSYPVSALERGDQIRARLTYHGFGEPVADRIQVFDRFGGRDRGRDRDERWERDDHRRRGRDDDRGRRGNGVRRLDGWVGWVDVRRGSFGLSQQRGRDLVVVLPRNADRDEWRRLQRLRRGDRVRVEVRPAGRGDWALVRFR